MKRLNRVMGAISVREPFSHDPLPGPPTHIRLLRILPGDDCQPIRCRIKTFDIASSTERGYVAISYAWGDSACRRTVEVDGRSFEITSNAHYALWQMRHHCNSAWKWFWIDSICINQIDNNEKSRQVSIMHLIYTNAKCVAACVGELTEDQTAALTCFTEENSATLRLSYLPDGEVSLTPYKSYEVHELDEVIELTDRFARWEIVVEAFRKRPYFSRAWITQELLLAKSVLLFAGDVEPIHERRLINSNGSTSCDLIFMWRHTEPMGHEKLSSAVILHSDKSCSDVRDKLYSLIGISPVRDNFKIDYNEQCLSILMRYIDTCLARPMEAVGLLPEDPNLTMRLSASSGALASNFASSKEFVWQVYDFLCRRTGLPYRRDGDYTHDIHVSLPDVQRTIVFSGLQIRCRITAEMLARSKIVRADALGLVRWQEMSPSSTPLFGLRLQVAGSPASRNVRVRIPIQGGLACRIVNDEPNYNDNDETGSLHLHMETRIGDIMLHGRERDCGGISIRSRRLCVVVRPSATIAGRWDTVGWALDRAETKDSRSIDGESYCQCDQYLHECEHVRDCHA